MMIRVHQAIQGCAQDLQNKFKFNQTACIGDVPLRNEASSLVTYGLLGKAANYKSDPVAVARLLAVLGIMLLLNFV